VAPDTPDVAATLLDAFGNLHDALRQELGGLNDEAANWVPSPGANSIATIVTHLLGSEAETLRSVAGVPEDRDRESEFSRGRRSLPELLDELRAADELIVRLRTDINSDRLGAVVPLPTLAADDSRPGLTWMVGNYGHAREHIGHIQLTKQLYRAHVADPEGL
jgi:hypothetical protein